MMNTLEMNSRKTVLCYDGAADNMSSFEIEDQLTMWVRLNGSNLRRMPAF